MLKIKQMDQLKNKIEKIAAAMKKIEEVATNEINSKEDSAEAIAMLKENMAASREAMKAETEDKRSRSAERIARENARSQANGQGKKTAGKN